MGRRGRPSKSGKRTKSGALARDGYAVPLYDHGTLQAQARKARYGTHGTSALGRAYATGLLGEEQEAKIRYQAGQRFHSAVERFFAVGRVTCPLDVKIRSGASVVEISGNPYEEAEWRWINDRADALDAKGLRPWLDQLILELYVDHGPIWLDRLLDGGRDPADQMVLKAAIQALDVIAPHVAPVGIRAVVDNST